MMPLGLRRHKQNLQRRTRHAAAVSVRGTTRYHLSVQGPNAHDDSIIAHRSAA